MSQARQLRVLCSSLALVAVWRRERRAHESDREARSPPSTREAVRTTLRVSAPLSRATRAPTPRARQRSASTMTTSRMSWPLRTSPARTSSRTTTSRSRWASTSTTGPGSRLSTRTASIWTRTRARRRARQRRRAGWPGWSSSSTSPPSDVDPERLERVGLRCGGPQPGDHDRMGSGRWSCAPDHPNGAWEPGELQRRPSARRTAPTATSRPIAAPGRTSSRRSLLKAGSIRVELRTNWPTLRGSDGSHEERLRDRARRGLDLLSWFR